MYEKEQGCGPCSGDCYGTYCYGDNNFCCGVVTEEDITG